MATATKKKTATATEAPVTNRRFTTAYVGNTPAGPFAFQLEGNLVRPCELKETKDGTLVLNNSIGVGRSAFAIMALAEGTYDRNAEYPDVPFVDLVAFGDVAQRMADKLTKGSHIVVAGKLSVRKWKDKAGAEHEVISCQVQDFALLGSAKNGVKGEGAQATVPATNKYTKDGQEILRPTACLVSGNVFSVDELAVSKSGTSYLHFTMFAQEPAAKVLDKAKGVDVSGKEYDPKKALIRCTVFGKQAEALAKLDLKKGMAMAVSGAISENEYEGKVSVQMNVNAFNVVSFEVAGNSAAAPMPEDAGEAPVAEGVAPGGAIPNDFYEADEDDDSELPF